MTQGIQLSEQEKDEIRQEVKAGKMLKREIAQKHNIHPTLISKILNGQKPAKRKVSKRAVKAKPLTKREGEKWEVLFDDYIAKRNAADEARKTLEDYVKELR